MEGVIETWMGIRGNILLNYSVMGESTVPKEIKSFEKRMVPMEELYGMSKINC
jgi:hypothetical protein